MALITVNTQDAIETRVATPRTGAWHADVLVDDPDALAGAARVVVDTDEEAQGLLAGMVLQGTIVRSGVFADTGHVRVVAGAAGLGLSAAPRYYQGPSVRTVLDDLLRGAGEALSPTADSSVLASGLDAWTTTATPVGTLISLLLAAAAPGSSWRMLADGTLWVGRETWPDAGVDSSLYQIFEDSAEAGTMLIGVDAPLQLVGTTFEGRRVSYTEATVGQEGQGVEMRIWFEDAATDVDRMKKAFGSVVQRAVARADRIDYGRLYPATIVSQSGGTVDVQPDQVNGRDLLPDMAGVPLLLGLPGASVDGTAGGRVMIGWLGGDPSQPRAIVFDESNTVRTIILSVLSPGGQLLLGGPGALPALAGTPFRAAQVTMNGALAAALSALAAASTGPLSALQSQFTAAAGAVTAFETAAGAANGFLALAVGVL